MAEALAILLREPLVALDTEFVGEASYRPLLCLIQVATSRHILIVDPLAPIDLQDFWRALTEPGREVIAFAARQELLFCLRYAGRLPEPVFDPQVAAGWGGYGYPLGLTNLLQKALAIRVRGGETYTEWRRRPLSSQQIEYAADDVRHLHTLRASLLQRAAGLGRLDWLVTEQQKAVERIVAAEREERWWRVSGASGLSRRRLAVLRELWRWRDGAAEAADQPPRRVMSDDLMIEITKRAPRSVPDLLSLRGLDRPLLRRAGPDIVRAVLNGLELPESQLPDLRRPLDDPPQVGVLAQLLAVLTNSLAGRHQVDAGMLATTADLQELVRWRMGLTSETPAALLEGWRGEVLGQALIDLLDGKRSVRVGDLQSPNPLLIEPAEE